MEFAITPPYRAGVVSDPVWMTEFVLHAEALGYESVYLVEHVAVPRHDPNYPYAASGRMPLTDDCPLPDPLELMAFLAARTSSLVFATGILVAPHHHPLILAKRLATIDVLSGGRVRCGVGVGWMREELEATGIDFSTRGRRLDEQLEILNLLWTEDAPSFAGEFYSFEHVTSRPLPTRGRVPIHVGGHSSAAARRAGRYGDGFQPLGLDDEALDERVREMRLAATAAGREPDAIELSIGARLGTVSASDVERASARGVHRLVLSTGTSDLEAIKEEMSQAAQRLGLSP